MTYPLPFLEFCPKTTPMDLTVEVCYSLQTQRTKIIFLIFRLMMFLRVLSYRKVIECFTLSKDLIPTNDSTHQMGLNLIYHYQMHSIIGNFVFLFFQKDQLFSSHNRDGCFECGEVSHIKVLVQILLYSSPPIDINRTGKIKSDCFLLRISTS